MSKNPEAVSDGWFYSTEADLKESTTFGENAQNRAINNLIKYQLIEKKLKGNPAKRHFKICNNVSMLENLIKNGEQIANNIVREAEEKMQKKIENRKIKKGGTSSGNLTELVPTKEMNKFQQFNGTCSDETTDKSKVNNHNLINHNLSQSVKSSEHHENQNPTSEKRKDRQTDRPKDKTKTYEEIMSDIGITSPELYHPDKRIYNLTIENIQELMQSRIPDDYYKDKSALETVVKYYSQWENAYEGFQKQSDKDLYKKICSNITELLFKEKTSYKKVTVTREETEQRL